MTSAQGSAGLAWCLGGHAISCAPSEVRISALSSMAALSSGLAAVCVAARRGASLGFGSGSERSTRSSAFSLPAFGEVPAHIRHSGRGGRLLPILIGSPTAVAIVPAPVSVFTIISASCSTHTILVRASSPGILARHKPRDHGATRNASHVGLVVALFLIGALTAVWLVVVAGAAVTAVQVHQLPREPQTGPQFFFRPGRWTRPRLVWDLSWRLAGVGAAFIGWTNVRAATELSAP